MDHAEIDRAIVCPFKPRGYELAPANETVAAAVTKHPDRLIGFARVDPWQGEQASANFERALNQLGLRGLFLHPWEENFQLTSPIVDEVLKVAHQYRVPVIVASGFPWVSEGLQVGDLARRFPEVPIIATNGCQINISGLGQIDAELALAENDNLMLQTAGVYREDFIEGIVARFGAERVLFSSAFPLMDPDLEILRARWAHLPDEAKDMVLGGNAARLLNPLPRQPAARG
jgi:predicted TIM-barrel fold metal-dependent hydrolase